MDKPFDNNVTVSLQRPAAAGLNTISTYWQEALRWTLQQMLSRRVSASNDTSQVASGFLHDGFKVRPHSTPQLKVVLTPGLGFQSAPSAVTSSLTDPIVGQIDGMGDLSGYKPLVLPDQLEIAIPNPLPPVGQSRYDIIEIRYKRLFDDRSPALRFDPGVSDFLPKVLPQTLTWAMNSTDVDYKVTPNNTVLSIGYKQGMPAATGTQVAPNTSPDAIQIARILVSDTTTAITGKEIVDYRALVFEHGTGRVSGVVEIPTTSMGVATPVVTDLLAPPGISVVVTGLNVNGAKGIISVIGGGPFSKFTGGVQVLNGKDSDTTKPTVIWGSIITRASIIPNAGVQADLADPVKSDPPGDFAIGQRLGQLQFLASQWTGAAFNGVGGTADFPNPLRIGFWAEFSY